MTDVGDGVPPDSESRLEHEESGSAEPREDPEPGRESTASGDKPNCPIPGLAELSRLSAQDIATSNWSAAPIVPNPAPPRLIEGLVALLFVVLADISIYGAEGLRGLALFFALTPLLIGLGAPRFRLRKGAVVLTAMLWLLAARIVWAGSALQVTVGSFLLLGFTMAAAGLTPYVLEGMVFSVLAVLVSPYSAANQYSAALKKTSLRIENRKALNVALPLGAVLVFGLIFIRANPDVFEWLGDWIGRFFRALGEYLREWSPSAPRIFFWLIFGLLAAGLVRPVVFQVAKNLVPREDREPVSEKAEATLYTAWRNTLVALIVLFAVYLVFEFGTLWFREFPEGFAYSGYAHEGAWWLTGALALATLVLSGIFQGSILADPRVGVLKKLGWAWSAENLILAVTVFHRLAIYMHFNGLSRMRMVGLGGIVAVVAGFVLVVWKIHRDKTLVWLVRRHLWALALVIYTLTVLPVDTIVTSYNVGRVMEGDPAPSVQISAHPIGLQAAPLLIELAREAPDEKIRTGVCAVLAQMQSDEEKRLREKKNADWRSTYAGHRRALRLLRENQDLWKPFLEDRKERKIARQEFDTYAYQWY